MESFKGVRNQLLTYGFVLKTEREATQMWRGSYSEATW